METADLVAVLLILQKQCLQHAFNTLFDCFISASPFLPCVFSLFIHLQQALIGSVNIIAAKAK